MRDPYTPLTMPSVIATSNRVARIEARRQMVLAIWLTAMIAVASVTLIIAGPAAAEAVCKMTTQQQAR